MKYLIVILIIFAAFPVHAQISVDGVLYTQKEYDTKKSRLISDSRAGNIDRSTRDFPILLEMLKRECGGKRQRPNGRFTWQWLINKFETGC